MKSEESKYRAEHCTTHNGMDFRIVAEVYEIWEQMDENVSTLVEVAEITIINETTGESEPYTRVPAEDLSDAMGKAYDSLTNRD